jgi:hypothetical protein
MDPGQAFGSVDERVELMVAGWEFQDVFALEAWCCLRVAAEWSCVRTEGLLSKYRACQCYQTARDAEAHSKSPWPP